MIEPAGPKPEFRSLAEDAVVAALQDPDPANPIAVEVARLIDRYTSNFHAHVRRLGRIPTDILRIKRRWPIEAVAMRLTTEVFRETFAEPTPTRRSVSTPARNFATEAMSARASGVRAATSVEVHLHVSRAHRRIY